MGACEYRKNFIGGVVSGVAFRRWCLGPRTLVALQVSIFYVCIIPPRGGLQGTCRRSRPPYPSKLRCVMASANFSSERSSFAAFRRCYSDPCWSSGMCICVDGRGGPRKTVGRLVHVLLIRRIVSSWFRIATYEESSAPCALLDAVSWTARGVRCTLLWLRFRRASSQLRRALAETT